jgi:hypothetical protein
MQFYDIPFTHPFKQSGRWQDVLVTHQALLPSTRLLVWMHERKYHKSTSTLFLAENQLDAPLLIALFILFFNSLHVSGTTYPSSGETKLF